MAGSCVVTGCNNPARHEIGVRLRKPGPRKAIWAPDTHAVRCDDHAVGGIPEIAACMIPTTTGRIETDVYSPGGSSVRRARHQLGKSHRL